MNSKGQTIVETAIILPILLILVLGIFEFGRAMYIKNTLNNAARAGARAAVVLPRNSTGTPEGLVYPSATVTALSSNCNYEAGTANRYVYKTVCESLYSGIPRNQISVTVAINDLDSNGALSSGDAVTVTVSWSTFETLISKIIPMGNGLSGEASMRYE